MTPRVDGRIGDNVKVLYSQDLSLLVDYIDPYLGEGWKLSGGVCRTPPMIADYVWMVTLVKEPAVDNHV